jgi:signal transduction histidine kinase
MPQNQKNFLYLYIDKTCRLTKSYICSKIFLLIIMKTIPYSSALLCLIVIAAAVIFIYMAIAACITCRRMRRSLRDLRSCALNTNYIPAHKMSKNTAEIAGIIADKYKELENSRKLLGIQYSKLLQHVHSAGEGICFFGAERNVEFCNGLFIQHLNAIIDEPNAAPAVIFSDALFEEVSNFLQCRSSENWYFQTQIHRHGREYALRVNIFDDGSFEVIIGDITRQSAMRQMKQTIADNITHELRTPVAGIRGCLETILTHALSTDKQRYFTERAYSQTLALSDLISSMTLIAKISDAPHLFPMDRVNISELLDTLSSDLDIMLKEKSIRMDYSACKNAETYGCRALLYAIFRNLVDNTIRHAGSGVSICIAKYNEDDRFCYFSYSDNGCGVCGHHLPLLFERFYRADDGRSRDSGGSGLGLSIVRNAVAFHHGTITAKHHSGGGLEFLFTLANGMANE